MFYPAGASTRLRRRLQCWLFTASTLLSQALTADVIVAFEFDNDGAFDLAPTQHHDALIGSDISVLSGPLLDFAGAPGRALGARDFALTNTLLFLLELNPERMFDLEALRFDQRVSASGPALWSLDINGIPVGDGATSQAFTTVMLDLTLEPAFMAIGGPLLIAFHGTDASSALGTLRLDNLVLEGRIATVPLPPFTVLFPLPALLLGYAGRRAASQRHSRQASSSGKYRPSQIGRPSSADIASA